MTDQPPEWFADAMRTAQAKDSAHELMENQEIGVMLMAYSLFKGLSPEAGARCFAWLEAVLMEQWAAYAKEKIDGR